MEHYLQTYSEPSSNMVNGYTMASSNSTSSVPSTPTTFAASTPLVTTTTSADQVTLPLTQGCLSTNLGVPIVIVCCKVIRSKKKLIRLYIYSYFNLFF